MDAVSRHVCVMTQLPLRAYNDVMKRIPTGRGYIPVLTLIAVGSLSLVVDLAGLAMARVRLVWV